MVMVKSISSLLYSCKILLRPPSFLELYPIKSWIGSGTTLISSLSSIYSRSCSIESKIVCWTEGSLIFLISLLADLFKTGFGKGFSPVYARTPVVGNWVPEKS